MNDRDPPEAGSAASDDRISRLSAAILRISGSLDLATVLQEIVDSARALTGARYGLITTLDEAGHVDKFVSSGFTPEEYHQLASWPDGPRLFEHLRDLEAPLRLRDLPAYVRRLGFSSDLMCSKTLQATPMRHRGEHTALGGRSQSSAGDFGPRKFSTSPIRHDESVRYW